MWKGCAAGASVGSSSAQGEEGAPHSLCLLCCYAETPHHSLVFFSLPQQQLLVILREYRFSHHLQRSSCTSDEDFKKIWRELPAVTGMAFLAGGQIEGKFLDTLRIAH